MEKVKTRPKCNTCGKDYCSNDALKRHTARNHEKGTRNFGCELCGKKFHMSVDLKSHVTKVHEKDWNEMPRNFKCDKCDKAFKIAANLRLHVGAVHDKIKNNKCEICNKSFFEKKYLWTLSFV